VSSRAYLNLRHGVPERRAAFTKGLQALGYEVHDGLPKSTEKGDVLVTWNRIGVADQRARQCKRRGGHVIVTENSSWGNDFAGKRWYYLAKNYHNTAGCFPTGGPERWDSLGVRLDDFRTSGETVLLPQRGIGSPPTRMPSGWAKKALNRYGGRIRSHPGTKDCVPLEHDLRFCGRVITWGSGAAIKALMMGIPVVSEMPGWVGHQSNTDETRLAMFRRLAWAQWTLEEIATGEPFARLIHG
jgi:hypothetical protein